MTIIDEFWIEQMGLMQYSRVGVNGFLLVGMGFILKKGMVFSNQTLPS
jgi:hypothetical protein